VAKSWRSTKINPRTPHRLVSPCGLTHYQYHNGNEAGLKVTHCEWIGDGEKDMYSWLSGELLVGRRGADVNCLLCIALAGHER
jgi:hypothetical protein